MLSKEIGNSEQRNRKENAWSPKATKFRRYDVPKMRRPGQCPLSATVLVTGVPSLNRLANIKLNNYMDSFEETIIPHILSI